MALVFQSNFVAGEIDPNLFGRVDLNQYFQGAESLLNSVVLPQGGARRRDGLVYVDELCPVISRLTGMTITAPRGGTTANANDDDETTLLTTTTNISTIDPYVVVHYDLGSALTIRFADVVLGKINGSNDNETEFFIQYSTDNVSWTSLGDAVALFNDESRTRRRTGPITAQYWRFARIGSTNMGTDKVQIAEFNLWIDTSTLSSAPS